MKLQNTNLTAALAILSLTASLPAATTLLGTHVKNTDGDETFATVFGSSFTFTSGNVYLVYDMTFDNATNPGTLDTTSSYGGYSHSAGDLIGQNWQQSTVGAIYYGTRNDIAGATITSGTAIKIVVKYELNAVGLDGDTIKVWVDPTLGTGTESAADDADPTRIWNPTTISSSDMRFRRGNSSDNEITFSNVTIYSDGDSPFAVVPEPSSTSLLGLGALALILRRRK